MHMDSSYDSLCQSFLLLKISEDPKSFFLWELYLTIFTVLETEFSNILFQVKIIQSLLK